VITVLSVAGLFKRIIIIFQQKSPNTLMHLSYISTFYNNKKVEFAAQVRSWMREPDFCCNRILLRWHKQATLALEWLLV